LVQSLHIDHSKQLSLALRVCLPFMKLRSWTLLWLCTAYFEKSFQTSEFLPSKSST
jgi:hypothetical protein